VAIVHGLPVASPRWVFESFRARRLLEIDQFVPRALEGLVVCTTGLSDDSRGQVEQLTTLHGGVYDSNLEIGYTSVLIAQVSSHGSLSGSVG
jgi:dihydrodipicolinate reductase